MFPFSVDDDTTGFSGYIPEGPHPDSLRAKQKEPLVTCKTCGAIEFHPPWCFLIQHLEKRIASLEAYRRLTEPCAHPRCGHRRASHTANTFNAQRGPISVCDPCDTLDGPTDAVHEYQPNPV